MPYVVASARWAVPKAGQRFVVFFLAPVHAAVFQQHKLAGLHLHAIGPVADQRHIAAQQLAQPPGDGGQRIGGGEFALLGAAQVRSDHDGRTRLQRHADGGHAGADAGVFGDFARLVQRRVQVAADEHALALDAALGAEVGKTQHWHGMESFKRGGSL